MAEFGPKPLITRDELIDLLRRNMEPHWVERLLTDPKSLAIFEGYIAAMLRIQDSGDTNFELGSYILTAPDDAKATATVRLTRPSGAEEVLTPNHRFLDDRGAVWNVVGEVTIPASGGVQTVDIPIETDRVGYWLNSFEPLTYQILDDLPDPNLVTVLGVDEAVGGQTSFLEAHGEERQVFQAPGEDPDQYRLRIRFLEDMITPHAIAQTVLQVLDAHEITRAIADLIDQHGLKTVLEPFNDGAQIASQSLAGEDRKNLQGLDQTFFDVHYYDDPTSIYRSREDACGWFEVVIPTPVDPNEPRRFYDDSDADAGSYYDDPEFVYFDIPISAAMEAALTALWDEIDRRNPFCVPFIIYVGEDLSLIRQPALGTLSDAGAWLDQDGVATDEEMTDAVASYDGDNTHVATGTGTGAAAATSASDLLYIIPAPTAPVSITRVICRAWIRKEDLGVGVDPDFTFVIGPTGGSDERVLTAGVPVTVDHEDWRPVVVILDENPITAAAWTLGDIAGDFTFGAANTAAAGPTDELRVSELALEFVVNYE